MKAYKGIILTSVDHDTIQIRENEWMLVNADGTIADFTGQPPADADRKDFGDRLILPGFIDTHTHLPQYPMIGLGNLPLLPWLERYTFPLEARFSDPEFAATVSEKFFADLLSQGTTAAAVYVTAHTPAAETAFAAVKACGIRAGIGKVLMDRHAPAELTQSAADAMRDCEKLLNKYHGPGENFLMVTPRFAISCSPELLRRCGEFSRHHQLLLQTHISENTAEIAETAKLFPASSSYAGVYDDHGCLHENTLLAHGIHLTAGEHRLIADRGATIVHCPSSNSFLGSGALAAADLLRASRKISLGTDVAAGTAVSMAAEARCAWETSKLRSALTGGGAVFSPENIFHLMTMAGAEALKLSHRIGSLQKGKEADFIVVDDDAAAPLGAANPFRSPRERWMRLLYTWRPGVVEKVFIRGRNVF